ncbi:hypothetical protein E2C01_009311 [Portunus trituberculatus]|uniref:Uncharacterized protein n=1 Tax=Portunus trituberculatus TaxID=210409 RepID=A0A5B7D358_PORTR|nr:hypothetical protein [Portunus trituberculatus]
MAVSVSKHVVRGGERMGGEKLQVSGTGRTSVGGFTGGGASVGSCHPYRVDVLPFLSPGEPTERARLTKTVVFSD